MMNPHLDYLIARERQLDLIRAADVHRTVREARGRTPLPAPEPERSGAALSLVEVGPPAEGQAPRLQVVELDGRADRRWQVGPACPAADPSWPDQAA
ncbi:MAG TPA: hypothetical protein VEK76_01660 [Candidatus Binatia bacterium]|nr:hypothetical protein [Candidatus Binatia bacterium]